MTAKQSLDDRGREGDNSRPSYVRARPHVKGSTFSLSSPNHPKGINRLTVEELLQWAYAREKVHLARPPGLDLGARLRPRGYASQASSERVGAAVGASMNLGFEAPRDAYAVHDAVMAHSEARLLREYALIGHAPDWTPDPVIWWEQGSAIYGKDRKGRNGRSIIGYCVFARGDVPALVAERRSVYARWAHALAAVHLALADVLADHVLADALPPLAPWD